MKNMLLSLVVIGAISSSGLIAAEATDYQLNLENGKKLYEQKCQACHGMKGEKKALNRSQIINTFTEDNLIVAINGYKNGTYGSVMKGLMKGQIIKYNDNEVKDLAHYISTLKEK